MTKLKTPFETVGEWFADSFKVEKSKAYFNSWSRITLITVYALIGVMVSVGVLFSYPSLYNRIAVTFGAPQFNGNFFDGSFHVAFLAFVIAAVLETGWSFSINQIVFSVMKKAFLASLLWLVVCAGFVGTSIYFQIDGANEFVYLNTEKPQLVGTDKKEGLITSKDKTIKEYNAKIDEIEKKGEELLQAIDKINNNPKNFYTSSFSGKKVMKTDAELALLSAEQRYKNWERSKDSKIASYQKLIEQSEKSTEGLLSSIDKDNGIKLNEYEGKLKKGEASNRALNILLFLLLILLIVVVSLRNHFVSESDFANKMKEVSDMERKGKEEFELFHRIIKSIESGTKVTTAQFAQQFNKGQTNTGFAKVMWNKYKDAEFLRGKNYEDYFGNSPNRLN